MTDGEPPPRLTRLTFHGPLSEARAARLVGRLTRTRPATVLDLGCGWGELMLRILAAIPGAIGTGVDLSEADLARGRDNAVARGLASRASFAEESAVGTTRGPADLVLCVGATHETASLEEWDDFESGYLADVEEWLAGHQDHPQAAETRRKADDHLSIWLRGARGCMGLAYLTLIPV
jgi:SAM-dependent methyltransferase